ncbi:MAG: methyltransferase [Candidatus Hydrogenedentes bacterium]|nr:methyltransferase [Candidatus Hydrogenedentota bacterium]
MAEKDLQGSMGRLDALARGFQNSYVIFAANELDIFALLEQPRTAGDVARARGLSERGTRILLNGLAAMELVVREGYTYRNTQLASEYLVPGAKNYQGHILRHMRHVSENWARLGEVVKTGTGVQAQGQARTSEQLRAFILGMSDIAKMTAGELLPHLDLSGRRHMLDLGGGPATYSITFLNAYPKMRATVFDFPDVIEIAREQVAEAGLGDRFSYITGDMTRDDIGSGYDLILLSSIIHSMSVEENRIVARKCYQALEPGGLFIIKDFLLENDRSGPPFGLMFAINMLVATPAGDTYTFAEVEGWTREAGFKEGRVIDLTPQSRLWLVEK